MTDFSKKSPKFSKTVSVKTNTNFTTVITLLERNFCEKNRKFTLLLFVFAQGFQTSSPIFPETVLGQLFLSF